MANPGQANVLTHRILAIIFLVCGAVIMAGAIPAQAGEEPAPVVIRGSSTLQPLVDRWVAAYRQQGESTTFDVEATGSSEGIEDLLAGQTDIALASRPMNDDELAVAREKGLMIADTVVARMGIAVVVNNKNPVSSVTVDNLAKIFSGGVRNWSLVGGPDEAIAVVRKDSGWSPDFFRRRIMGDRDFVADSVMVDSKEGVVSGVADRPWSIGVTGMPEAIPALDRIRLIRIVSGSSEEDSTYALSRPLFFFSIEGSPTVQPFLDFVLMAEAQKLIEESGFYPARQDDAVGGDSE